MHEADRILALCTTQCSLSLWGVSIVLRAQSNLPICNALLYHLPW
jgi:hypothetical protein